MVIGSATKMRKDTEMKPVISRTGSVLGYENDVSPYRQEIRDKSGGLLGTFNPHTGQTQGRSGKVITNSGDVRASLIPKGEK
jgi:hypothetical protein